jgi:hypothetical protein
MLEGIVTNFGHKVWVEVGARRDVRGNPNTLDGYIKEFLNRAAASYVAAMLDVAGVVELDRGSPLRMRVIG